MKKDDQFKFESDLIQPRQPTDWNTSFEQWSIKTALLSAYGHDCMNPHCARPKREGINLELTQINFRQSNLRDFMDLSNYHLLCRYCKTDPHMKCEPDCRPENWAEIISNIIPIKYFEPRSNKLMSQDFINLEAECVANGATESSDHYELKKSIRLARLIIDFSHELINRLTKNMSFTHRASIFRKYMRILQLSNNRIEQIYPDAFEICYKTYGLFPRTRLGYLTQAYGGYSQSSQAYALVKHDLVNEPSYLDFRKPFDHTAKWTPSA